MKAFINEHPVLFAVILVAVLWDFVWRILGMWHAARLDKPVWFVAFVVFGTIGILPIIFLRMNRLI